MYYHGNHITQNANTENSLSPPPPFILQNLHEIMANEL